MSAKVTQDMTVTEDATKMPAKFAFNYPVLKTKNGALKFIELVIEIVCLNILVTREFRNLSMGAVTSIAFLMICFLSTSVITSLLFVSYLMSPMAESVLTKTIFELVSNVAAFIFFIMFGMALFITINQDPHENPTFQYAIAVAVMGVINGILYFLSSYFSFKTFKSI